jgi:hypothetical protein
MSGDLDLEQHGAQLQPGSPEAGNAAGPGK